MPAGARRNSRVRLDGLLDLAWGTFSPRPRIESFMRSVKR